MLPAKTRSSLPSLFKSPTAIALPPPTSAFVGASKLPSPFPRKMETYGLSFATARSVFPSPLKSPAARSLGGKPSVNCTELAKRGGACESVCASMASSTEAVKIWTRPFRVSDQKGWALPSTEAICM